MSETAKDSRLLPDNVQPFESDLGKRRALGIYYTPRSAAALLAEWAIRAPADIVLEPSFGGCTILEAVLHRLRRLGNPSPEDQMIGFDVDRSAFIHLHKLLGGKRAGRFLCADFLTVKPFSFAVDTVIANPPFVSYHRMDGNQRATISTWRAENTPSFPMTASLWAYFVIHALSFLKPGSRMAFVLPAAVASSDYSQPIVDMLIASFDKLTLYKVNEQLFIQAGADERTVIMLADGYRTKGLRRGTYTERSIGSLMEFAPSMSDPAILFSGKAPVKSQTKLSTDEILERAQSRGALCALGSLANVKIGEVTGDTDYFVKPLDSWQALGIGERHLRPIITRGKQVQGLIVTKKDVSALYSPIPRMLCPAAGQKPKKLQKYLNSYTKSRLLLNKTFSKREPWYAVTYDVSATAFIASMSQESPRITLNKAGVSCSNGLYKITSKTSSPELNWIGVASLTSVFRLSAEMNARARGSGALKLEPSDVASLLVPSQTLIRDLCLSNALKKRINELVRRKELEAATREADNAIFVESGVFAESELQILRERFQDLRGERLPQKLRGN